MIDLHQMKNIELTKELKKRGLKGYSSLKKDLLVEYLSTGIHPLKKQTSQEINENEVHESYSDRIGNSQTFFSTSAENLPVNKIVSGDCLDILPTFPDGVFDCCITDPPFNMSKTKGLGWAFSSHVTMQEQWDIFSKDEYFQFTSNWIREVLRVLKTNGNLFIFGSFHCIFTIGFILQNLYDRRIISQIVWYKPNAQPNITCRMFTESTEFIIWVVNNESKKAKNWTFNYDIMKEINSGKQMRNMWEIPITPRSEKKHGKHPSQKPIAVINRIVLAGSNEGDLILDPFSGSGTTAVVADQLNRKWIMIERDEAYNRIAHMRVEEITNRLFDEKIHKYNNVKGRVLDRYESLKRLSSIEGQDLRELAEKYGVPVITEGGGKHKGWVGHVIEKHLGLPINSLQEPNAGSWELKMCSLKYLKSGKLTFKETMAITMFKPDDVASTEFEDSHLFAKLRSLIVAARIWESKDEKRSIIYRVTTYDLDDAEVYRQVKEDYEIVQETIRTKGFSALTGKMGVYIQPRTKGAGHGSTSRAFYARKSFLKLIFPEIHYNR